MDESHVQHAIRLVKDEQLDLAQVRVALVDQVQQPTRRGNEHIDAVTKGGDLLALVDAPEDDRVAEVLQVSPVSDETVEDLRCQLAGRCQHECSGCTPTPSITDIPMPAVFVKQVQDRQRKGAGLASPGLGGAEDVGTL